jgi:hypothetical protein
MSILEAAFHYANVTRYLSGKIPPPARLAHFLTEHLLLLTGAGLVALVYDHILTLPSGNHLLLSSSCSVIRE